MDLFASNTILRKSNIELIAQLAKLKSRNEELAANHVGLIEENTKVINQMDGVKDELDREKAVSASLKSEMETATLKVQTIAVDAVLSARAELKKEFKKGEHTNWDPNKEIRTWKSR